MIHMVAHFVSIHLTGTFFPHPASSSTPTLASHGGLPAHMILKPEPHLRPLSTRREPGPIEDHHPASHPPAVESTSSTRARPPISGPSVHTIAVTSPHTIDPLARDSLSKDARPKKKQRAMNTATPSTTTKPHGKEVIPSLPVIRDIPPEGFNPDDSDDATNHGRPASNPRPASPPPGSPSAPVNDTSRPPTADAAPIPATAKSSTVAPPATPATIAPLDRRSTHSSICPWTDADDHELCQLKNNSKSRPSWKTISQRLRRDPEVCKIRWSILKQTMPEANPRNEEEAED